MAEAAVCIITGSVPALRPLLATILPNFFDLYRLDDLAANLKDNIRRAASRQSSRRRPDFEMASEGRSSREQSANAGSKQDWSYLERNYSFTPEADQNSVNAFEAWSLRSGFYRARGAVANILETFKGPSLEELTRGRQGRPLSVINELEEASDEGESQRGRARAIWDSITGVFENKMASVTSSLASAKRRLASLELPRLSVSDGTKTKGSIIVITEIVVSNSRRESM